MEPGADRRPAAPDLPGPAGLARLSRDDLPGALPRREGRAEQAVDQPAPHRPAAAQATPPRRPAPRPVRRARPADRRTARRRRAARPGRGLGRRPDRRAGSRSAIATLVDRSAATSLVHLPLGHGAEQCAPRLAAALGDAARAAAPDPYLGPGLRDGQPRPASPPCSATESSSPTRPARQCPSNENTNGLLRQYFPKRTDLLLSPTDLAPSSTDSTIAPARRSDGAPASLHRRSCHIAPVSVATITESALEPTCPPGVSFRLPLTVILRLPAWFTMLSR